MKRKTAMSLKWGDKVIRKGVNVALQFVRYDAEIDFIFAVSEGGMEYSQSRRDLRRADKPLCPKCAEAADRALKEPPQKGSAAEVLDTALVTIGSTLASFPDAKVALDALIDWHVAVAVDPAVNGGEVLVPKSAIDSAAEAVRKTCNVAVDDKLLVSVENWNAIVAALNCMIETDEVISA